MKAKSTGSLWLLVMLFTLEIVWVVCRRGVVKSWVPPSSITCFVYCFSCSSDAMYSCFSSHYFVLSEFLHLSQKNSGHLPSPGWSSCFSLRSRGHDKSRIPFGGVSGPSVWALSPFQFLLCSTQFVMLCVSFVSPASLAVLFM